MDRAPASELRKALVVSDSFVKMGIDFVPMPILNSADKETLFAQMIERLEKLEAGCNE